MTPGQNTHHILPQVDRVMRNRMYADMLVFISSTTNFVDTSSTYDIGVSSE